MFFSIFKQFMLHYFSKLITVLVFIQFISICLEMHQLEIELLPWLSFCITYNNILKNFVKKILKTNVKIRTQCLNMQFKMVNMTHLSMYPHTLLIILDFLQNYSYLLIHKHAYLCTETRINHVPYLYLERT